MSVIRIQDLHDVARLRDPLGVVSVYVTVDPQRVNSGPVRPLDALRRRDAELGPAFDALEPAVDRLLDPAAPGRGRVLFARLGRGDIHAYAVQVPLGESVRLSDSAHLWPLAAAFSAEAPAGIVAVSGSGVRVVDYRLGHAGEIAAAAYDPPAETRELAGARPGARHATPRDLHERRMAAHLITFLTGTGERLGALPAFADWQQVLVTGDAELVAAFTAGLPAALHAGLVTAGHTIPAALPPGQVAALVSAELRDARGRAHARLAEQVRDAAFAGGAATYGPADTARAAGHGRVRHLLLDGSRVDADRGEPLIEQTYRAGGLVTVVDAADALAGGAGVAAFLRPVPASPEVPR